MCEKSIEQMQSEIQELTAERERYKTLYKYKDEQCYERERQINALETRVKSLLELNELYATTIESIVSSSNSKETSGLLNGLQAFIEKYVFQKDKENAEDQLC